MLKYFAVCAALLSFSVPASAAPVGPDAAACRPGSGANAIVVSVGGLKARVGLLRVWLFGPNPKDFLARGKKLRRVELPASASAMDVCIALPKPGRYAVAVRHDTNGNRDSDLSDGGGFSRNPKVSLANLKPAHKDVAFNVGPGVHRVPVTMLYRRGLSIRPIKSS